MNERRIVSLFALMFVVALPFSTAIACAEPPIEWLTGAPLSKALQQPIGVSWSGTPVREAIAGLSRTQRVAVLIDRRIDPSRKVELSLRDVPLADGLRQIAEHLNAGYCQLGAVAYLGPKDTAARLRTLAELRRAETRKLSPSEGSPLVAMRPWRWDDLTTPRDLLAELEGESHIEIRGVTDIPHDLWAAADLPAMPWSDRVTLIAAQFGKTFEVLPDQSAVRLVPLPEQVAIERTFMVGRQAQQLAQQFQTSFPNAETEIQGNRLKVRGSWEDLESIAATLANRNPGRQSASEGKKVHTLKLRKARLDQILTKLEELSLTFEVDQQALLRADIRMDTLVSVDVKNAELDELLRAVLEPAGLGFRRSGQTVEIFPAAKPGQP